MRPAAAHNAHTGVQGGLHRRGAAVGQDDPASNWYESLTLDPACIDAGYAMPKSDTVGALASCIPRNIRLVVCNCRGDTLSSSNICLRFVRLVDSIS